jgi:transposase-like protein
MENTYQRHCPICNRLINYKDKYAFKKAQNLERKCTSCGNKSRPKTPRTVTPEFESKVLDLHNEGLTTMEIIKKLGVCHGTFMKVVKKYNLEQNKYVKPLPYSPGTTALECTICKIVKPLDKFIPAKTAAGIKYYGRQCRQCLNQQQSQWTHQSLDNYLPTLYHSIKSRAIRNGITFELTREYYINLFKQQGGKCFYTDVEFNWKDKDLSKSISLDKIIPSLGYIEGNVVFCSRRINTMKNDATLDEMKKWMPDWYNRIILYLNKSTTQPN